MSLISLTCYHDFCTKQSHFIHATDEDLLNETSCIVNWMCPPCGLLQESCSYVLTPQFACPLCAPSMPTIPISRQGLGVEALLAMYTLVLPWSHTVRSVHYLTPPSNHPLICFSCNHDWETVPSGQICLHNDVSELMRCRGNSCYGQRLLWKRCYIYLHVLCSAGQMHTWMYVHT